jgi:hypothetical protein
MNLRVRMAISPISRGKMLDNLRRTPAAPTAFLSVVEYPHIVARGLVCGARWRSTMGDGMPIPLADGSRMHQVRIVLG